MKKLLASAAILSVMSFSSQASLITTVTGNVFEDLGVTTVDKTTGLEWLDVTMTAGRSYNDVSADINADGGMFDKGLWRFATAPEMVSLGMNWFGIDTSNIVFTFLPEAQERSLEIFIQTFGDTLQTFLADSQQTGIEFDEMGAGFTQGFIDANDTFPNSPFPTKSIAMFLDDEYTITSNQYRYNGPDILASQYGWLDTETGYADVGSFLVRDFNDEPAFARVAEVSEPQTFLTMFMAILGIGFMRNKKRKA